MRRWVVLAAVLPLIAAAPLPVPMKAPAPAAAAGVYIKLATVTGSSVERVVADVRAVIAGAGWKVLADYDAGVNRQKCAYLAHVFVVDWPEFTRAALRDSKLGAFAAQVRVSVFEDESGVHVAMVNPRSVSRTVVAEQGRDEEWAMFAAGVEKAIRTKLPGRAVEYGQMRDRGRIGRTMGVMAGGPFPGRVQEVLSATLAGETLESYASALYARLEKQQGAGEWKLRPVFLQLTSNPDVAVIGITSERVEAKSFDIVGAGGQSARAKMRCHGIDHAAAYPLELVVVKDGGSVKVQVVDEMFRMKMYFEDAGMMAFMQNMGMPGSIGSELRQKVRGGSQ